MPKKRPLPISNTGLRRTRGGQSRNAPAQPASPAAAPEGDPRVRKYLGVIQNSLDQIQKQPAKSPTSLVAPWAPFGGPE